MMTPLQRTQMLQASAEQILTRDVIERFGTVQYRVARRLARNTLRSTGLAFSVNKQVKTDSSMGISVATEKAYALMDDLEDAHLIPWVGDYTLSVRDNPRRVQKAYAVDPGLALAVAPVRPSRCRATAGDRRVLGAHAQVRREPRCGHRELPRRRLPGNLVVGDAELLVQYELVQVCEDIGDAEGDDTRRKRYRREIGSLASAMRRCGLSRATVVTLADETTIRTDAGVIDVMPAWKWCLVK